DTSWLWPDRDALGIRTIWGYTRYPVIGQSAWWRPSYGCICCFAPAYAEPDGRPGIRPYHDLRRSSALLCGRTGVDAGIARIRLGDAGTGEGSPIPQPARPSRHPLHPDLRIVDSPGIR